jgi:hypothetical protein
MLDCNEYFNNGIYSEGKPYWRKTGILAPIFEFNNKESLEQNYL